MEITIATSLGHYIDVQNGEANALVKAACDTFASMEFDAFPGIQEFFLILCKFEVPVVIIVYLISTKCVRTIDATIPLN